MINKLTDHEIKVIGFDADDTLWKNEDLFFEAQDEIKDNLTQISNNYHNQLLKTEKSNEDIGKFIPLIKLYDRADIINDIA